MRTFLFTCILAVLSISAHAQIDAKLNVGSAIFGGLGLAADFGLNENSSLSAGLGYARTNVSVFFDSSDDEYRYDRFRIIPEYRYYVSPREGADRFFVGAYSKLTFITASSEKSANDYKATRGALGVLFGNKWVTDSGFLFELNMGVGRGVIFSDSAEGSEESAVLNALTALDFRLGIIAGYRF